MASLEEIGAGVKGHVLIRYADTREIIREVFNAINYEALSMSLAMGIADRANGHIYEMVFGNGGSTVTSVGNITYLPPNVNGLSASLYNQTFSKIVDDMSPLNSSPADNYIRVQHTSGLPFSDIQITCTLGFNEPSDQLAFDNSNPDLPTSYIFDELGLRSYNSLGVSGSLISHAIFHPIQKALNRAIEVIYTIRINVG